MPMTVAATAAVSTTAATTTPAIHPAEQPLVDSLCPLPVPDVVVTLTSCELVSVVVGTVAEDAVVEDAVVVVSVQENGGDLINNHVVPAYMPL